MSRTVGILGVKSTPAGDRVPMMVLDGLNGWSPLLVGEQDGTRSLFRVADWSGGSGAKPPVGYVGPAGATGLVSKADAFNFNLSKRVAVFSGATITGGYATIPFVGFDAPPVVIPFATPAILAGALKVTVDQVTKAGCRVRVQQQSLAGLLSFLVGATVQVICIEA